MSNPSLLNKTLLLHRYEGALDRLTMAEHGGDPDELDYWEEKVSHLRKEVFRRMK